MKVIFLILLIISDLRTRLNSDISGMLMYLSESWDWYEIQMGDEDFLILILYYITLYYIV